jgi:hypothetical protein
MPDQVPPPWEGDPLSKYFADAEHNTRASAVNWPDVYEVQQGAHALLRRLLDAIENERGDSRDVGSQRMLIHRSHGAILATMRLTMSGQAIEAMPVLRLAIEEAWYALHIAKDPAPPTRARIWWNRDDSPQATQACREEFSAGNVRRTHEGLDPRTATSMKRLYDDTITYGGHPNSSAVALGSTPFGSTRQRCSKSGRGRSARRGPTRPDLGPTETAASASIGIDEAGAGGATARDADDGG